MKRIAVLATLAACSSPAPSVIVRPLPPLPPAPIVTPAPPPIVTPLVDDDDDTWGSPDARVTMVVFVDLITPWMTRMWPSLVALRKAYSSDKLRIVLKYDALEEMYPSASYAAEAAHGAYLVGGPDVAWQFLTLALADRRADYNVPRDELVDRAKAAGVKDMAAFERGLDARAWAGNIERAQQTAQRINIRGVPVSYINGIELNGARPADSFREVIDKELAEAEKLIASGTPAREVSVLRTRANQTKRRPDDVDFLDQWWFDAPDLAKRIVPAPVDGAPAQGPASALITVVAYVEPSSHYCGYLRSELENILSSHEGDIRVVWRTIAYDYAFHSYEDDVANFLLEARAQKGDAGYLAALAKFCPGAYMKRETGESPYTSVTKELGLDVARTTRALKTRAHQAELERESDAADDFGAGSNTIYIDGHKVQGHDVPTQDGPDAATIQFNDEVIGSLLEQELNRSRALLRSGVTRDRLYAEKIKNAVLPAAPVLQIIAPSDVPSEGSASAKVIVQEFIKLPCSSYCRDDRKRLTALLKPLRNRVRLVIRPFGWSDERIAEAALEVFAQRGTAAFWKFVELTGDISDRKRDGIDKAARKVGVDMKRFSDALDRNVHQPTTLAAASAIRQIADVLDSPKTDRVNIDNSSHAYLIGTAPAPANARPARYRTLLDRELQK